MNAKVIIIGIGGIGSRHFEALLKCNPEFDIELRDFEENLSRLMKQFKNEIESFGSSRIHFSEVNTPFKFRDYDLAIIATGASNRLSVLRELVTDQKINNLILEKPIANSIADLLAIAELAKEIPNVRMNTPRENMEFYKNIKSTFFEEINEIGKFELVIRGHKWGLLSNCLHFIRLTEYLTGTRMETISEIFKEEIYESKRVGYYDFHGSLTFTDKRGNSLTLIDSKKETEFTIEIKSEKLNLVIDEKEGKAKNERDKYVHGSIEYQSSLTTHYYSSNTRAIIASLPLVSEYLEISAEILKKIETINFPQREGNFKFT